MLVFGPGDGVLFGSWALDRRVLRMSTDCAVSLCMEVSAMAFGDFEGERLRFRRVTRRSWFDRVGGYVLGRELNERLRDRFRKGGLFVTLTYDQSAYADAEECFVSQSEDRHVRRFIERLSKHLGVSLRGKWFRKLEFQENGWPHFHLLIDWRSRIEHAELERLWGHGFVWVEKITPRKIRYCTKYVVKELSDLPPYVLIQPIRSLKIVAVSPGLWGPGDGRASSAPVRRDHVMKIPMYKTVGDMLERNDEAVEFERLKCWETKREAYACADYYRLLVTMGVVYQVLHAHGGHVVGHGKGWVEFVVVDFERFLDDCALFSGQGERAQFEGEGGYEDDDEDDVAIADPSPDAAQRPGEGRLHLTHDSLPPMTVVDHPFREGWLREYLLWKGVLEWRDVA